MNPVISVIIPVYNRESTIINCLDSLKNQTFTDFEAIIVDGQSIDNTAKIVKDYCKNDQRFKYIRNNDGHVTPDNVCLGLKEAKGNYISFIDSDDSVDPCFLSVLYNNLIKFDCDISQVDSGKSNNVKVELKIYKGKEFTKILKNIYPITKTYSRCARMFKRDLIEPILYYYSQYHDIIWEDTIFTFALFLNAKSVVISNERLYKYYFVRNNDCPKRIYNKEYFQRIEKLHNINIKIFDDFRLSRRQAYYVPVIPIYEWFVQADDKIELLKAFRKDKFIHDCLKHFHYKHSVFGYRGLVFIIIYKIRLPLFQKILIKIFRNKLD